MGSIVSTGIGSGLDIENLVKQLVTAEGAATSTRLNSQEAKLQAKLSAYGSLRSAIDVLAQSLAPLKDLSKLQSRAVASANEKILTATADSTATPGTYAVEVERLAQAAKLRSGPFATGDTVIGTGTLTLKLGTATLAVTIDSTHNTLALVRDAINGATGNPGIAATIVTGTDGAHLVLTGTKTGAANGLIVTQSGGDGGLAAITYDPANGINFLTSLQTAVDSRVVIDGLPLEGATNSVSGAVTGLTFNLTGVSDPDVTTNISVSFDKAATTKALNDFAKAYNALVAGLKPLATFDAKTSAAGPLLGDSTLRDFLTAVRRSFTATVSSATAFTNLSQIGFSFALDGTLTVDATKLGAAIDGNFDAVGKLLSSTDGVAKRLDALVSQYTSSGGLLDARTKGIQSSIDDIGDQRVVLQGRLDSLQSRLRAQFNAMDTLVARLKSTSNFLTQQLSASAAATINNS